MIFDVDEIKNEFLKSFKLTNNVSDYVNVHVIKQWCKNKHVPYNTIVYKMLNDLNCSTKMKNGTRYRSGLIKLDQPEDYVDPKKQTYDEPCRYCNKDSSVQVAGGFACKECVRIKERNIKYIDVCLKCSCPSSLDEEALELYRANCYDRLKITHWFCSKCTKINYQRFCNAGIYIWFCKDLSVTEEYIGKSINIAARMSTHYSHVVSKTNYSNTKLYNFIREHGGYENWEFNVLEVISQDHSNWETYMATREKWWIEKLEPKLNTTYTKNSNAISFLGVKPDM